MGDKKSPMKYDISALADLATENDRDVAKLIYFHT